MRAGCSGGPRPLLRPRRAPRARGVGRVPCSVALAAAAAAALGCTRAPPEAPTLQPALRAAPSATALRAADWPSYNRDLGGTRFSPLAQVNAGNVANLKRAWTYDLGRNTTTGSLAGGSELTPLAVAGVLYLTTADRVVALDAAYGAEIWSHSIENGVPSRRGLGYWPGDAATPARIFVTVGRRLLALEAATGRSAPGFGTGGEVEMPVVYTGAPTVFENLVIVGSNSPPGSVRAFDARSGEVAWVFHSVPLPGEFGHDSWLSDAWRDRASVLAWSFSLTVDVDRALLYASFAGPGADDDYGGGRPGNTLYANSVVALDARTGVRRWHFQTVHHDLWNYDLPAAPTLVDIAIDGAVVPLLAQPSKSGYLYILNRVTGEPVFGVDEKTVPSSDVPGEQSAATQPIPKKPPPLARVDYSPADLVTADDTTPEHAAFCKALVERSGGLGNAGPFTPYRYRAPVTAAAPSEAAAASAAPGPRSAGAANKAPAASASGAANKSARGATAARKPRAPAAPAPPRSTVVFPGSLGGANWGGAAADAVASLLIVNTLDVGGIGWIEPAPFAEDAGEERRAGAPYRRASAVGGPLARFWWNDASPSSGGNELGGGERAWPCQKPPWGELAAVNLATGDIAWRVPLGITAELPDGKNRTGRLNIGGPIVTAGGLVFIGATNDRRFRAFAERDGDELWSAELPMSAHAVPITYLGGNGKQYVAVVAAGAAAIDTVGSDDRQQLVVFGLP